MKIFYWLISFLWIPVGRISFVLYELKRRKLPVSTIWRERLYKLMLLDSGFFGFFTPFLTKWANKNSRQK